MPIKVENTDEIFKRYTLKQAAQAAKPAYPFNVKLYN
jgi:hypothetical protein